MEITSIVDTNVIVVANFQNDDISPLCVASCVAFLGECTSKKFAVDSLGEIFNEYFRYASRSGLPRVGDAFAAWLWNNQSNPKYCTQVEIIPTGNDDILFEVLPQGEQLKGFDRADQKFLAVALSLNPNGTIVNAVDSDWAIFKDMIQPLGVQVLEICSPDVFGCCATSRYEDVRI